MPLVVGFNTHPQQRKHSNPNITRLVIKKVSLLVKNIALNTLGKTTHKVPFGKKNKKV